MVISEEVVTLVKPDPPTKGIKSVKRSNLFI